MIFKNLKDIKDNNFHVIIVGSGPAGISLALKLEEQKIDCLILEAGQEEYSDASQKFYKSKVIGDNVTNLDTSRLRQFGGTSAIWGGWSKPMENYNLSDWEIDPKKLKEYFDQTVKILNIKNQFRKTRINNDFNQIEFQYSNVRFKEKYKKHISKSKYINLILNTQVLNFNGDQNLTKYVECIFAGDKYRLKSNYFVLAAGGIENSRILLWTKQINNLLDKNLPIGNYWMTHPWFLGGYGVLKKEKLSKFLDNNFIDTDGPLHVATSKYFKTKHLLSGSLYMSSLEDEKFYKEILKDVLCIAPKFGKKIARNIFKKDLKCGNIFLHCEELPKYENRISLDKKVSDANGIPITNLFYKKSKSTLITAKQILEEFANICRELDIGRVAIKEDIHEIKQYESLGIYHHLGGTRMGVGTKDSVVDVNLKVHKNKNLFITGSSIFPSSGYTNPTFTIVQLSLKLGDHISKSII